MTKCSNSLNCVASPTKAEHYQTTRRRSLRRFVCQFTNKVFMPKTQEVTTAAAVQTSSSPEFRSQVVVGNWAPEETYPAFVPDLHWNGWLIPHFTYEIAMRVAADNSNLRYVEHSDVFVLVEEGSDLDDADLVTFAPNMIKVGDLELKVYAIGGFHWCWEPHSAEDQPTKG
jgi:hypothetical protein